MEQITAMKITGITFTDFRNHKAPESYTFGDISYITGHNGTGKTTICSRRFIASKFISAEMSCPF